VPATHKAKPQTKCMNLSVMSSPLFPTDSRFSQWRACW
jgi:hypothetical protein